MFGRKARKQEAQEETGSASEDETLVRAVPHIRTEVDAQTTIVLSTLEHKTYEVDPFSAQLLGLAGAFRTVSGHVQEVVQRAGRQAPSEEFLTESFASLKQHGLLAPLEQLRAGARQKGARQESARPEGARQEGPQESLTRLVVTTADRPELLKRCLQSFVDAGHAEGLSVVISDDSRRTESVETNKKSCAELSSAFSGTVEHVGRERRRALSRSLAESAGVDTELTDFALLGPEWGGLTTGANRNTLLLQNAGERYLTIDDDVLFELLQGVQESQDTLEISSSFDPTLIEPFPSREEVFPALEPASSEQFLQGLEEWLGAGVAGTIDRSYEALQFEQCSDRMFREIARDQARTSVVVPGYAGDAGMSRPQYRLDPTALASDEFIEPESYEEVRLSREVCRSAGARSLRPAGSFLMLMFAGIDNRTLLPPFVPFGRNSDGLFSQTLGLLGTHYIGHFPQMIRHEPEPREDTEEDLTRWFEASDVQDVLSAALSLIHTYPLVTDPEEKLPLLGDELVRLTQSPQAPMLLTQQLQRSRIAMLDRLEGALNAYPNASPAWIEDVQTVLRVGKESLVSADLLTPRGISSDNPRDELWHYIRQYGRLLTVWPQLWNHARDSEALL
jgi:hypothetical protein